jgi:hypothetical protein
MTGDEVCVRDVDLQLVPKGILPCQCTMRCLDVLGLRRTKSSNGSRGLDGEVKTISLRCV